MPCPGHLKHFRGAADTRGKMRDNQEHLARTKIRATCPDCGEVELRGPDVALKVCTQAERSFYAFTCPDCLVLITKPADDRIVRLLVSGGVRPEFWEPPAELLERHDGPALDYDDLLDLHLLLASPDWWSALCAADRASSLRE